MLRERCTEVGATLAREGLEFGVTSRVPAVGGQMLGLQGLRGSYDEVFLPLYGAHQAQNAALALAAVEAFLGGEDALDAELVREAFAEVTSPGGWRSSAARRRSCSTPRTTRTAPRRSWPRWRTPSPSRR